MLALLVVALLAGLWAMVQTVIAYVHAREAAAIRRKYEHPTIEYLREQANQQNHLVIQQSAIPHLCSQLGYFVLAPPAFEALLRAIVARGYSREDAKRVLKENGFPSPEEDEG